MIPDTLPDAAPAPAPADRAPPAGFSRHFRRSGFTDPWEPLWSMRTADAVHIGLWAAAAHCNSRGFVHGALLSGLADNAMGLSCGQARGPQADGQTARLVTVNLALDFIASGRQGQWIEVQPSVVRAGSRLCFATALILADGRPCARANATFSMAD